MNKSTKDLLSRIRVIIERFDYNEEAIIEHLKEKKVKHTKEQIRDIFLYLISTPI